MMLDVHHYLSKGPRVEAFPEKTLYRDEPFAYRAELARAHRRYTSKYAKAVVEINLLIDALAPAGLVPDSISPLPPRKSRTPDFELTFGDEKVYCECTTAGDASSMLWRFSVADLEIAANDLLQHNPDLTGKLGPRYLAFIPGSPIRPDDILRAVDEIGSFIASEDLAYYGSRYGLRVPEKYRLLSQSRAVAYTSRSKQPLIVIQQPASAFGGTPEGVAEILRALRQKQEYRYDGFRPIWLVIGASDVVMPLSDVVKQLRVLQPSLDPFQRVFVATSRESFVLTHP
jgi:hypothetical protein